MSEITSTIENGKGKIRSKKVSTKIDMTPMVDLAFLLLTFFVMTTELNKARILELNEPDKVEDPDQQQEINAKNVLTIIAGENNKVYWYSGTEDPVVKQTDFSSRGIRQVLLEKKKEIPKLVVLLKGNEQSKYQNMIDMFDEMAITGIARYYMVDITKVDNDLIKEIEVK